MYLLLEHMVLGSLECIFPFISPQCCVAEEWTCGGGEKKGTRFYEFEVPGTDLDTLQK